SPPTTPSTTRPRCATSSCATNKEPDTQPRDTPTPPAAPGCAWPPADPEPPTSSPPWPTPTWTRSRWWPSPARSPHRRSAPTPSRKPTSAASRCRSPNTTPWSRTPTTSPASRCASVLALAATADPALPYHPGFVWPKPQDTLGPRPVTKPRVNQVPEADRMITAAKRPVLYGGGGALGYGAAGELRVIAE